MTIPHQSRKSHKSKSFSHFFSAFKKSLETVPESSEETETKVEADPTPVAEADPVAGAVAVAGALHDPSTMLKAEKPSRRRRLSKFLPSMNTEPTPAPAPEPKVMKDPSERLIARKPAPAPYRPSSPVYAASRESSAPLPQTSSSPKRLQKPDLPNRQPPPLPLRADSPARPTDKQLPARPRGDSMLSPPALADLAPPPPLNAGPQARSVSSPVNSRPNSSHSEASDGGLSAKLRKRRSWIPGGASRSKSRNNSQSSELGNRATAWINTGGNTIDYSLTMLTNGDKVPELWDDGGDAFVYLFPRSSGHGPSFRVPSMIMASSQVLLNLVHGDVYSDGPREKSFDGRQQLTIEDATRNLALRSVQSPPNTPNHAGDGQSNSDGSAESMRSLADAPRENHLFLPTGVMSVGSQLSEEDIQALVDIRNLFAFLTGQPLVATRQLRTMFSIFLSVARQLKKFGFTNFDGSTYGEAAAISFNFYHDEMRLSDVRTSREKTLEGIILGEHMRSQELYNEAFVHAVGKFNWIRSLDTPLFPMISGTTRNRLDRANMDLSQRQANVALRLNEFEFPSLFAGIASSTSTEESKFIRFKAWKLHFLSIRKQVLAYYKDLHGQWPPRAGSKKNSFVESGLNRLALKGLYADLGSLYCLLVDRSELTTRSYDDADEDDATSDPTRSALRKLLSEYDRSSPPVQPPIPYDFPLIPQVVTVQPHFNHLGPKDQNKMANKKLKDNERMMLLTRSHNLDSDYKSPFLHMFKQFEEKESKGKSAQEMADMRYGYWIFMYAVIQALPMLVVDAAGVRFVEGVEYFLCEPPMGNVPWVEDVASVKMAWYGIQGGQGVVSLPSDVVTHGVEGIYRRSYCWTMAEKWLGPNDDNAIISQELQLPSYMNHGDEMLSPLDPPPGLVNGELGNRPQSRGRSPNQTGWQGSLTPRDLSSSRNSSRTRDKRASIALGLERLPIPASQDNWSPDVAPISSRGSYGGSRTGSPAGLPGSAGGRRQASFGGPGDDTPVSGGSHRGSTFDDILGTMQQPDPKPKGKGKGKK